MQQPSVEAAKKRKRQQSRPIKELTCSGDGLGGVGANSSGNGSTEQDPPRTPTNTGNDKCVKLVGSSPIDDLAPIDDLDALNDHSVVKRLAFMANRNLNKCLVDEHFGSFLRLRRQIPREAESLPQFISLIQAYGKDNQLGPDAVAYMIVRVLLGSQFAPNATLWCTQWERETTPSERIIEECVRFTERGVAEAVFRRNWHGMSSVPPENRVRVSIVDDLVSSICRIINKPIPVSQPGKARSVGVRPQEDKAVRPQEDAAKAVVVTLMNSSGSGKTSAVIDAARCAGCDCIRVMLDRFASIIYVVTKRNEFLTSGENIDGVVMYGKSDTITEFQTQYNKQLPVLFNSCLNAIVEGKKSISGKKSLSGSLFLTYSQVVVPSPCTETDCEVVWQSLVQEIPDGRTLVIHVDECQAIFLRHPYPENGDLTHDDPFKRFSFEDTRKLALNALICALQPYIGRTSQIAWVFTGLRPNLHAAFNIPSSLRCEDLSGRLSDFSVTELYDVIAKYAEVPKQTEMKASVKSFLERLVGPPCLIPMLLDLLSYYVIKDLDDMVKFQYAIEARMLKSLKNHVQSLQPNSRSISKHVLRFCCIAPILSSRGIQKFKVDSQRNRWTDMVAAGIIRLKEKEDEHSVECTSVQAVEYTMVRAVEYTMVQAYPILQQALCEKTKIPARVVDSLCRSITETGHSTYGKASELAFLTTLALKEPKVTAWMRSALGIRDCLPPNTRVEPSSNFDFGVEGHVALHSSDPSRYSSDPSRHSSDPSRMDSGADLAFEATLIDGEKVCTAVQVTFAKDKSEKLKRGSDKFLIADELERMAHRAISLFQAKSKRTIIVYASAFETISAAQQSTFCQNLPLLGNSRQARSMIKINERLPPLKRGVAGQQYSPSQPYAVIFVNPGSPIWKQLIIPKHDIDNHNELGMRKAVLNKLLPELQSDLGSGHFIIEAIAGEEVSQPWTRALAKLVVGVETRTAVASGSERDAVALAEHAWISAFDTASDGDGKTRHDCQGNTRLDCQGNTDGKPPSESYEGRFKSNEEQAVLDRVTIALRPGSPMVECLMFSTGVYALYQVASVNGAAPSKRYPARNSFFMTVLVGRLATRSPHGIAANVEKTLHSCSVNALSFMHLQRKHLGEMNLDSHTMDVMLDIIRDIKPNKSSLLDARESVPQSWPDVALLASSFFDDPAQAKFLTCGDLADAGLGTQWAIAGNQTRKRVWFQASLVLGQTPIQAPAKNSDP